MITKNNIMAESLAVAARTEPGWDISVQAISCGEQAPLDIKILDAEVALLDISCGATESKRDMMSLCREIHRENPDCHMVLLVSRADPDGRQLVSDAVRENIVEDFLFTDASLAYVFAKLSAF